MKTRHEFTLDFNPTLVLNDLFATQTIKTNHDDRNESIDDQEASSLQTQISSRIYIIQSVYTGNDRFSCQLSQLSESFLGVPKKASSTSHRQRKYMLIPKKKKLTLLRTYNKNCITHHSISFDIDKSKILNATKGVVQRGFLLFTFW